MRTTLNPDELPRGGLGNSRVRFERDGKGHVAFMGGSITEMDGYSPMVAEALRIRFPEADFTFTNAGISSTCSTTGAFRLSRDVLDHGPVDLFFVEFAVNDDQDAAHARTGCIRGMEGIVRHTRARNPNADMVFIYFVNPEMLEVIRGGRTPLTIASHEEVARHYGIPAINLAKEVADGIDAGELDWETYGGTHPAPFGNRICAGMVEELLDAAWSGPLPEDAKIHPHRMPGAPLDTRSYVRGRFVDIGRADVKGGWSLRVPDWDALEGRCRDRFRDLRALEGDAPGAELKLAFEGTAIGAYVLAGPDAGTLEASVDGGASTSVDLYHRYSKGLHYPRTVMFDADLSPGRHELTLRVTERKNPGSSGTAARILEFVAN